jgi:hypothetical protein
MTFFTPLEHSDFDLPHVFSDEALNVSSDGALVIGGAQSLNRLSNDVPILESLHQHQFPRGKFDDFVFRIVFGPSLHRTRAPNEPAFQCPDCHLFDCNLFCSVIEIIEADIMYFSGVFVSAWTDVLYGKLEVASAVIDSEADVFLPVSRYRHCVGKLSNLAPLGGFPKLQLCTEKGEIKMCERRAWCATHK